jgi:hypothetical protein
MEDIKRGNNNGAKRSQKKYDISEYTFPIPDFMTDIEIRDMYRSLTFHMKMKYGVYDEETIHRTIIRGLHKADMYDSKKASKLVWFQSILYFYWIQEKSSKYNPGVNDLSLSTSLSKDDPNYLVIDTIDGGDDSWVSYAETEDDSYKERVAHYIQDIIINGNYPYLQMRCMGFSYRDIQMNSTGEVPSYPTISTKIHNERERLKEELKSVKEVQSILSERVPVWMWTINASKKKTKEEFTCRVCSILFTRLPGGGSKLYCSDICRKKWKVTYNMTRTFQCKWCKKEFNKPIIRGYSRTYCSDDCKREFNKDYQKMVYRKKTGEL